MAERTGPERPAAHHARYAMEEDSMASKIPVILSHESAWQAFSVFNPNDWRGRSKPIINSCAANYGLLVYGVAKIESIFGAADSLCQPRVEDLVAQWKASKWDVSSCMYLVDIPEAHLSIHAFLSTAKTFLDVFVQLIRSEGLVSDEIHGFHKKGDNVGARLLHVLSKNAHKPKKHAAMLIHDLICEHKKIWIDDVVNGRDSLIHPEQGLAKVMFGLELYEADGELRLGRILKPSFNDEDFDTYARKTLSMVEAFSKKCMEYLKKA
jgi:hypothetical protein